jgi:cytochrome c5
MKRSGIKTKLMKYKVLSLAVLSVIIYSCASKSSVPTTEVKKAEPTPVATVATVMTPELAEGKSLYDNNCAKCHKLYDAKDFSSEEWKPIVARMQKKAHLDDLQGQKIYNYLTMN